MAEISLSAESLPNAIKVATKIAIGTARASIQAKLRNTYSKMREKSNPFPKNLSILRSRKFANKIKSNTNNAMINGVKCSLTIYLFIIFTI
jgi:hypothetical protein